MGSDDQHKMTVTVDSVARMIRRDAPTVIVSKDPPRNFSPDKIEVRLLGAAEKWRLLEVNVKQLGNPRVWPIVFMNGVKP